MAFSLSKKKDMTFKMLKFQKFQLKCNFELTFSVFTWRNPSRDSGGRWVPADEHLCLSPDT